MDNFFNDIILNMLPRNSYEKIFISVLLSLVFFTLFYFFLNYKISNQKKITSLENKINILNQKIAKQNAKFTETKKTYDQAIEDLILESQD